MFEWILENSVMAGLLAVVVAVVARLNRTRPALCHLLWLMVLVVMLMPRLPLPDMPGPDLRQGIQRLLWSSVASSRTGPIALDDLDADEPAIAGPSLEMASLWKLPLIFVCCCWWYSFSEYCCRLV